MIRNTSKQTVVWDGPKLARRLSWAAVGLLALIALYAVHRYLP